MTFCPHGINHSGERHGCDGCCKSVIEDVLHPEEAQRLRERVRELEAALEGVGKMFAEELEIFERDPRERHMASIGLYSRVVRACRAALSGKGES